MLLKREKRRDFGKIFWAQKKKKNFCVKVKIGRIKSALALDPLPSRNASRGYIRTEQNIIKKARAVKYTTAKYHWRKRHTIYRLGLSKAFLKILQKKGPGSK